MSEIVEINGECYAKIEHSKHNPKTLNKLAMIAVSYGMVFGGNSQRNNIPNVNIVKEYELICQKKSKLSKSQRDSVIASFKRNYKKI